MREFLINQVFGLNGLVNLSNVVFLLAFSVRDVLKLRVLSVAAYCVILPYYYFQPTPLWPPFFWGVAFIIVNGIRIVILALERRPVVLNDKEEEVYQLVFRSLDRREFLKLISLARWVNCAPGDVILKQGQDISEAIVLISGDVEAKVNGKTILALRPGQLIGDVNAFSGLPNPADVVARSPASLAKWDLQRLAEFLERKPELRANLLQIESADLAAQLRELGNVVLQSR